MEPTTISVAPSEALALPHTVKLEAGENANIPSPNEITQGFKAASTTGNMPATSKAVCKGSTAAHKVAKAPPSRNGKTVIAPPTLSGGTEKAASTAGIRPAKAVPATKAPHTAPDTDGEDGSEEEESIALPSPDHPVYGERGIMHGVIRKSAGVYLRNPQYAPRDALVMGHNGLEVGAWFPVQMSALFHGARGRSQGGISGTPEVGAYSIVISGKYRLLDNDQGDMILYSGSRDVSALRSLTRDTRALTKSVSLRNPIRVLRSSHGNKCWAPDVGLRYDGLYEAVAKLENPGSTTDPILFRLVCLEGQPPLADLMRTSPTDEQKRAFPQIQIGY